VLPHLRSDPIRTFLDAADRYGDFVHLKAGPYHGFLLSEPADIKHVLQDNARNYHKSPLFDRLKEVVGNGLLTSEDSFWLRQRRLAQPAFHRLRLIAMADAIVGSHPAGAAHYLASSAGYSRDPREASACQHEHRATSRLVTGTFRLR
jgi:cytochrome P450